MDLLTLDEIERLHSEADPVLYGLYKVGRGGRRVLFCRRGSCLELVWTQGLLPGGVPVGISQRRQLKGQWRPHCTGRPLPSC
jgi:hypothetical protein